MKTRFRTLDRDFDKGGFGKIIVVYDDILERKVAIKKLQYLDDKNRGRFEKEAKILASLTHPNIPAIYDVEFSDSEMYIEFQFIEGCNLRTLIENHQYPSIEEARKWFSQISLALEYAHSKNIIHRDIKPENIIISNDRYSAYLVDFGIALSPEDTRNMKSKGYVIGTPGYIAPEYIEKGILSNASDVFSLGVTLYESLTGTLPVHDTYNNISDLNESVPPAIDDLIKFCIIKDHTLRLQKAKDFYESLKNALRIDIPFSAILTESRLYEIQQALMKMSAEEFHSKPIGQRLVVLTRLKDLVKTKTPHMLRATTELLKILIDIASYEEVEDYKIIFISSLEWGFEIAFGPNWNGDAELRIEIAKICKNLNTENHKMASSEILTFIQRHDLKEEPGWLLYDLRPIVLALLANPNARNNERELAKLYENINNYSHKNADSLNNEAE